MSNANATDLRQIVSDFLEWLEGATCPAGLIERARRAVLTDEEKADCGLLSELDTHGADAIPADLLEAVDTILETAPCDCSHKRRYENGEHLSGCYLFDLNHARNGSGIDLGDRATPAHTCANAGTNAGACKTHCGDKVRCWGNTP